MAPVAQLAAQLICNQQVPGSNPGRGSVYTGVNGKVTFSTLPASQQIVNKLTSLRAGNSAESALSFTDRRYRPQAPEFTEIWDGMSAAAAI